MSESRFDFEKMRLPIAIGLSVAIVGAYFIYTEATAKKQPAPETVKVETRTNAPAPVVAAPLLKPGAAVATAGAIPAAEQTLTLSNRRIVATFTTKGGVIKKSVMLPQEGVKTPEEVDFEADGLAGLATGSLISGSDFLAATPEDRDWKLSAQGADWVEFRAPSTLGGQAVEMVKTWRMKTNEVLLTVRVENRGTVEAKGTTFLVNGSGMGPFIPAERRTVFDVPSVAWIDGGSYNAALVGDFLKALYTFTFQFSSPPVIRGEKPVEWVAAHNRFYFRALVPVEKKYHAVFANRPVSNGVHAVSGYEVPLAAAAGGASEQSFRFYFLPKARGLLNDLQDSTGIHFPQIFDQFDITRVLGSFFYYGMTWANGFIGNFGLTIILLTLLLKLVTWPLNQTSLNAMQKMGQLAPRIQEIQAKYKGDSAKANAEVMALYKKEKVNPLSGCLPILIQIPIFVALYSLFRNMIEVDHVSFLWITDLGLPDTVWKAELPLVGHFNLNVLPLLMTGTQILQSALTPSTPGQNNQQAVIFKYVLPLFFLFLLWSMPSALTLYWTVQNVVAIVQTLVSKRVKVGKPALKKS